MATGYDKILEQQKEMQKQVGKVHTHLMANSRVTSAILPALFFGGGLAVLCSGMYRLYTGAPCRRRLPLELTCTEYRVDTVNLTFSASLVSHPSPSQCTRRHWQARHVSSKTSA